VDFTAAALAYGIGSVLLAEVTVAVLGLGLYAATRASVARVARNARRGPHFA